MATVKEIRNGLIEKILTIRNKEFLIALDNLISSSSTDNEIMELSTVQKEMLEMSEADIRNGSFISQEAMDKRTVK